MTDNAEQPQQRASDAVTLHGGLVWAACAWRYAVRSVRSCNIFSKLLMHQIYFLLLRPCFFQIPIQCYSHIKKKNKSQKYINIAAFCSNWSLWAFHSQQSNDNAVCRRRFNTLLTCSRTVFLVLCKHDTSQSNTNPLCLIRAALAHCDWITPIIWEHKHLLYQLDSLTTRQSQWKMKQTKKKFFESAAGA